MFTSVALNAFLTRATLKGLTLENVMFVYVSFVLCWDGFCKFDLSKDEKFLSVHLCMMELVVLMRLFG